MGLLFVAPRIDPLFLTAWSTFPRLSRADDLYDQCDLYDLYELSHVAGWELYHLRDTWDMFLVLDLYHTRVLHSSSGRQARIYVL